MDFQLSLLDFFNLVWMSFYIFSNEELLRIHKMCTFFSKKVMRVCFIKALEKISNVSDMWSPHLSKFPSTNHPCVLQVMENLLSTSLINIWFWSKNSPRWLHKIVHVGLSILLHRGWGTLSLGLSFFLLIICSLRNLHTRNIESQRGCSESYSEPGNQLATKLREHSIEPSWRPMMWHWSLQCVCSFSCITMIWGNCSINLFKDGFIK